MEILPRSAWGAEPPRDGFTHHRVERITVHESGHAVRDEDDTLENLPAYQADHLARGWPDIAYHFVIGPRGRIYRGRRPSAAGDTATAYDPTGHLLVMCDGAFRLQTPALQQLRSLVEVLASACATYDVPSTRIGTHRDVAAIACPGARLYELFAKGSIRRRVERRLRAGSGPTLTPRERPASA